MNFLNYYFSNKNLKILIAYGSQTGNAESISNILSKKLSQHITDIDVFSLNNIEILDLNKYDNVIFIISTTGDGDMPDNASKFWNKFRRYKEKNLTCHFCILGLGSTDYNNFCFAAKSFRKRMFRNTDKEFLEAKYADDATGLEDVVEPWFVDVENYLFKKQKEIQNWFIKSMTQN